MPLRPKKDTDRKKREEEFPLKLTQLHKVLWAQRKEYLACVTVLLLNSNIEYSLCARHC